MKAYQILQHTPPDLIREIFHYLRTEQKEVYQTSLASLAALRKLRPVFLQRKPPEGQYAFLAKIAQLKSADSVDEHLLQLWLLKAHQKLLVDFLDGLGIKHDGEGAVDDLPESLDAKKLKKTVESLLGAHDPEVVRLYLNAFQLQRPGGWAEIAELIAGDDRLNYGTGDESAAPAAEEETKAPAPDEAADAPEEKAPARKAAKKKTAAKKSAS